MEKPTSIDEYLAGLPAESRVALQKLRELIQSAAPEAIYYGMPAFKYQGTTLVSFAAFKDHCSLFPLSVAAIETYKDELKDCRTSKGTLQFTADKPLPAALVKKLVKARMAENEARQAKRSRKRQS